MSTVQAKRTYTPADLLAVPDSQAFELVNGELVERNVGVLSSLVEAILNGKVQAYCETSQEGWSWNGTLGLQCYPSDPNRIRRADCAFVRRTRMQRDLFAEGYLRIAPDMVAEVISPNDLAYEVEEKIQEYLQAGVSLVWVINPDSRIVTIHRADGTIARLHENDDLTGERTLPGFRCKVADLFPSLPVIEATA